MLLIRITNYLEWLGPLGKLVKNSTKLTCLEVTVYRIKYSTVLWLLELQIMYTDDDMFYEGRSKINASYFIMLAHDVRGECCWYGSRGWPFPPIFR